MRIKSLDLYYSWRVIHSWELPPHPPNQMFLSFRYAFYYAAYNLVQAMHVRFGSTTYDDPMEAFTRRRQTFTIVVYKAEFKALSNIITRKNVCTFLDIYKLDCLT